MRLAMEPLIGSDVETLDLYVEAEARARGKTLSMTTTWITRILAASRCSWSWKSHLRSQRCDLRQRTQPTRYGTTFEKIRDSTKLVAQIPTYP